MQELKINFRLFSELPFSKLGAIGFFLLPFDSLRIFPIDSVYRPAWILPFTFIGLISIVSSLKVRINDFYLLIAVLYLFLSTILSNIIFQYPDNSNIAKFFIICSMLGFGVIGLNVFFRSLFMQFPGQSGLELFSSVILLLSAFPIVIGFIQVPGELFGFYELNGKISNLFSYRYVHGRIHMVSGEPSWAARYLLFLFVITLFSNWKHIFIYRLAIIILLLFTGSSIGYFSGIILLITYFLFSIKPNFTFFFRAFILSFFLFIVGFFFKDILQFSPYAISRIEKVSVLFTSLNFNTLLSLASLDISILARFMNPLIAFDLSLSYPLGIGGESFKYWILDKLNTYGYVSMVSDSYLLSAGSTPKLLVAKILVEHGYLFTFIILGLFLSIFFHFKHNKLKYFLFSTLIFTISDDSYLFYGLIIPICLAVSYTEES